MGNLVAHGNCVRSEIPEEVLALILKALPPAAYCQSRCVWQKSRNLLSSEPDWNRYKGKKTMWSVVTTRGHPEIRALCPPDEAYLMPQNAFFPEEMNWTWNHGHDGDISLQLFDVDKGIFCLGGIMGGVVCLAVCNPVSRCIRIHTVRGEAPENLKFNAKLLVDVENKSYKILYAEQESRAVVAYSSSLGYFAHFSPIPERADDMFMWKGVVYAYSTNSTEADDIFALDLKSWDEGNWSGWIKCFGGRLPGGEGSRYIASDGSQVMLVRFYLRRSHTLRSGSWRMMSQVTVMGRISPSPGGRTYASGEQ